MKKILPLLLFPFLLSCGRKTSKPTPGPLVDTAGALAESRRSDLQFAAVRDSTGKAGSTRAALDLRASAEGTLERDARRYADTLVVRGAVATSRDGRIDWKETWRKGRFDRPALALAVARQLVDGRAALVEWSLDSAQGSLSVRVLYQLPGPYGGPIDSVVFGVDTLSMVRR
jgi:hypothetical protein